MARKKRRGRPPGSKNRPGLGGSVAKMDVAQLNSYIASLRNTLTAKIERQRDYFKRQLANLGGYGRGNRDGGGGARDKGPRPRGGTRRKPKPKYQSKKNPHLKWTGRGMLPVWMRDEMKGTKLKKENFLIK